MSIEAPAAEKKLSRTVIFSLASSVGTILASAGVVMWAIIANPPGDTVGKAFLSIFLTSAFTFSLIAESRLEHKATYITPARIALLVLIVISGLYMTWNQVYPEAWRDLYSGDLSSFMGVIILLEGVVATLILFWPQMVKMMKRPLVRYTFNIGMWLTIAVSVVVSIAWTTWDFKWSDQFWRVILAFTVLALVMFMIPLVVSIILTPKKPKPIYSPYQQGTGVQAPNTQQFGYAPPLAQQPSAAWDTIVARGETVTTNDTAKG